MRKALNHTPKVESPQWPLAGTGKVLKTVRIVKEDGRGAQVDFGYRLKQLKCKNGCEHHNHLVCVVCGRQSYLDNQILEKLQDRLAKASGFSPKKHDFQIYGVCANCQ